MKLDQIICYLKNNGKNPHLKLFTSCFHKGYLNVVRLKQNNKNAYNVVSGKERKFSWEKKLMFIKSDRNRVTIFA